MAKAIGEWIDEALRNEDLRRQVDEAAIKRDDLERKLEGNESRFLEAAASEARVHDRAKAEYEDASKAYVSALQTNQEPWLIRSRYLGRLLWGLAFLLALYVVAYLVLGFLYGWSAATARIGLLSSLMLNAALVVVLMTILGLLLLWRLVLRRGLEAENRRHQQIAYENLGMGDLEARLKAAEEALNRAVVDKGVVPELKSIVNDSLTESYSTALQMLVASGLAEVSDPWYEVETKAKVEIRRLLEHMSGGSIGIAGQRGAGKTTLLASLCGSSATEVKGRPKLPVMTAAPVEYEAREFTLHLFLSVCLRVLELERATPQTSGGLTEKEAYPWDHMREAQQPLRETMLGGLLVRILGNRGALIGMNIGVGLASLGFVQAMFEWIATSEKGPMSSTSLLREFVNNNLIIWGFLLSIGSFFASSLVRRDRVIAERQQREAEEEKVIVRQAQRHITNIRFQQSFTSGYSGSLKVPIAPVEVGASEQSSVSFAQAQLSLPEIVDRYRDFIQEVSNQYEIVIGIDELDKLESDEKAQRFLNDIKMLFGLDRCFYLVCVSESALSSFERRGMPIRDVFDSSLDTIVYVDYLNLQAAKRLLRRRVIGVPVPFLDFCFCMAGGLPRDLIRTFRTMYEHSQLHHKAGMLPTLCSSVIQADVKAKLRAVNIAANDLTSEPKVHELVETVYSLDAALTSSYDLTTSKHLLETCRTLRSIGERESADSSIPAVAKALGRFLHTPAYADSSTTEESRDEVASLSTALAIYLYYAATIFDFFVVDYSEQMLRAAERSGALDELAKARQLLTVSPRLAETQITTFRTQNRMVLL